MAGSAKTTKDHEFIRKWVEDRDGKPARVKTDSKGNSVGILRINFPLNPNPRLEEISWDEFFKEFDAKKLVFLYQDTTSDGELSRFHKFIREA